MHLYLTQKLTGLLLQGSRRALPAISAILLLAGAAAVPNQAFASVVSGKMTFDRVGETQNNGLNYNSITKRPIRHGVVEFLDAKGKKLGETVTSDTGTYSYDVGTATSVQIRVLAKTDSPKVKVEDNTNQGAMYSMVSAAIDTKSSVTYNMNAPSGWDGSSYSTTRVAAPFACMDTLYTAARAFTDVRPAATFKELTIFWSVNNRPEDGDVTVGQIGTSHYSSNEVAMYILGAADVDTDEYDQHVMAHEWGHYFENVLGRSNSIGGTHSNGDIIDPRVSFGEGWGNATSAMVLYPDPVYKDSSGVRQANTFSFDVSAELPSSDTAPGWFSEVSEQSILYNIFKPGTNAKYSPNLGLGVVYDVMTGGQKTTDALTTIFSFTNALKSYLTAKGMNDVNQTVDKLTTYEKVGAVKDEFGTGETNDGGAAYNLPVYRQTTIGGTPVTLTFDAAAVRDNALSVNKYIRFTATDSTDVQINGSTSDITLTLLEKGKQIGYADAQTGTGSDDEDGVPETITFTAKKGQTYILAVQGTNLNGSGTYTTKISVQ